MIFAKLTTVPFGRPSVVKAVLSSLGLHLIVVAAAFCFSPTTDYQINLAGMRNVVQVETSFFEKRPEPAEENEVVVEPEPVAADSPEVAIESLPVAVARATHVTPVNIEPSRETLPADPDPGQKSSINPPEVVRQEIKNPTNEPKEPPTRETLRRKVDVRAPRTSVRVEQIAGLDDTTPPDFHGNPPPAYPATAVSYGMEGTVLLRLFIAATGRVQRVEIVSSSGHDILDRAAVEAVSKWRGSPAFHAGVPSPTEELLPIRFRL